VSFVRKITGSSCLNAVVFLSTLYLPKMSNQNSSTSNAETTERQISFEEKRSNVQLVSGSWAGIVNGAVPSTPTNLQICPVSSLTTASYVSMERDHQELLPLPTKYTTVDLVIPLRPVERAGKEKLAKSMTVQIPGGAMEFSPVASMGAVSVLILAPSIHSIPSVANKDVKAEKVYLENGVYTWAYAEGKRPIIPAEMIIDEGFLAVPDSWKKNESQPGVQLVDLNGTHRIVGAEDWNAELLTHKAVDDGLDRLGSL
jgi:hypothetical protein